MDTDELSEELYNATIGIAADFHEELRVQFDMLADDCEDEEEYLAKALEMISDFKQDIEESIEEIFSEDIPTKKEFKKILDEIKAAIEKVEEIPIEKRSFLI